MWRVVLVGVAIALAAALFLRADSPRTRRDEPEHAGGSVPTQAVEGLLVQVDSPGRTYVARHARTSGTPVGPPELVTEEEVAGDEGRLTSLRVYRRFVERARVTPEQSAELQRMIADAAQNYRRLELSQIANPGPRGYETYVAENREKRDVFNGEMRARAAEILTAEQLAIFDHFLPEPFLMAEFPPVRVELEPLPWERGG